MKHNAEGSHTADEFISLCKEHDWKCAYCGKKLNSKTITRDHIVPLTKGGNDYIENIAPACLHCNVSKSNKIIEEFMEKKLCVVES